MNGIISLSVKTDEQALLRIQCRNRSTPVKQSYSMCGNQPSRKHELVWKPN